VVDLTSADVVMSIPTSDIDDAVARLVRSWPSSLGRQGLSVSTGPVVAFRAREFVVPEDTGQEVVVPLIWLQNVQHGSVVWPAPGCRKEQYFRVTDASRRALVPNKTLVLLRRFTAKEEARRLTPAVLHGGSLPGASLAIENHVNYIHRPSGELDEREAIGLAGLLGSALLDRYFRISNGNTQVSAAELRALPLPSRETLLGLGDALAGSGVERTLSHERTVARVLGLPQQLARELEEEADEADR
jgi:adenine-specific DNA-methyltransferase